MSSCVWSRRTCKRSRRKRPAVSPATSRLSIAQTQQLRTCSVTWLSTYVYRFHRLYSKSIAFFPGLYSRKQYWTFFTALRHSLLCWRLYYLRASLSVRPSVRLSSVIRWYCVKTNEATIMRFSPTGRTIILVSGEVRSSGNSQGITPSERVKMRRSTVASETLTNNEP